jgi:site-specific recombinase XerD
MQNFHCQRLAGTLTDAMNRWLAYSRIRRTERTYDHYQRIIDKFRLFCPDSTSDLTVEHIEAYLAHVASQNTNRTANAHLTAIKSFSRWLADHTSTPNIASSVKPLTEDPPRQRVLTPDEYQKVLATCKPGREHDTIAFIGNSGLRAAEFLSLTWHNIDLNRNMLMITSKGRKRRIIPLNKTCRAILQSTSAMQLLESYHNRQALNRLTHKLATKARIPMFGVHAIRHYFATELCRRGVPLAKVSKILGHSSVRTTERIYLHWLDEDLAGLTDCLDQ